MKYFIKYVWAVFLCVTFTAYAVEPAITVSGNNVNKADADLTSRESRERSKYSFNVAWAPVHVPFPMALGFNANYVASENWMFGLDYMSSNRAIKFFSYELGEVNEKSLTLQARRFYGNSFNWKMGIGHRRTEVKLAQSLFDLATTDYSLTVSELRANFFRFGFGNQWQFNKKYTLVVDWFTINIPFNAMVETSASQYGKTASDKQDIENAENILKYYPSGSTIQFEAGFMF